MLARRNKLDPDTLFSRPHRTLRGDYLMAAFAPSARKNGSFAVVVSAKTAPTAVLRHRVKRALFDTIRAAGTPPFDVVISVRRMPSSPAAATQKDALVTLRSELISLVGQFT